MSDSKSNGAAVVQLIDVEKTYRSGEMEVRAVRGVSLEIHRGRIRGPHGRERLGKIHADEHARLPRPADRRTLSARWRRCLRARSRSTGRHPQRQDRLRFPRLQPAGPHIGARKRRVAAALRHRRTSTLRENRNARQAWPKSACRQSRRPSSQPAFRRTTTARGHCPRAGQPSRKSCSPTSRPAISTRKTSIEIMGVFQELNDSRHHHRHGHPRTGHRRLCKRIVVMRDGLVRSDREVSPRLIAKEEIAKITTPDDLTTAEK